MHDTDVPSDSRVRRWGCWRKGLSKQPDPQDSCSCCSPWRRAWGWMDNLAQRDISHLLNSLTCFIQLQHRLKGDAWCVRTQPVLCALIMPRLFIKRGEAGYGAAHQALYSLCKNSLVKETRTSFCKQITQKMQNASCFRAGKGLPFTGKLQEQPLGTKVYPSPLHEKQTKTNSSHPPSPGGSKTACEGAVPHLLLAVPNPRAASPNARQCPPRHPPR